jgi:hypothetical protein
LTTPFIAAYNNSESPEYKKSISAGRDKHG